MTTLEEGLIELMLDMPPGHLRNVGWALRKDLERFAFIDFLIHLGLIRKTTDMKWRRAENGESSFYETAPYIKWPASFNTSWESSFYPFGVFRNLPQVKKWQENRLLPRRWGFHIFGFEFGDRG